MYNGKAVLAVDGKEYPLEGPGGNEDGRPVLREVLTQVRQQFPQSTMLIVAANRDADADESDPDRQIWMCVDLASSDTLTEFTGSDAATSKLLGHGTEMVADGYSRQLGAESLRAAYGDDPGFRVEYYDRA
jgi:hypothetical protein